MAYVTGTAASFADLVTAIRNACTTNGWALAGSVLSKGTCFARVANETAPLLSAPANSHVSVEAGLGVDGSNNLTDAAGRRAWLGLLRAEAVNTFPDWTWPVAYHIHVMTGPDEVWVFVNYNGDYWQWLGFGQSPAGGNPGTGNWHTAAIFEASGNTTRINDCRVGADGVTSRGGGNLGCYTPMPFWVYQFNAPGSYSPPNYMIHGVVDDTTGLARWSSTTSHSCLGDANNDANYTAHTVTAARTVVPLYRYSPSIWNSESMLVPVQITQARAEKKTSLIGQLEHARMTRNHFIEAAEVITRGADKWKVYPCYRRNVAVTGDVGSGSTDAGANHSGTFAIAVRYDGP